MMMREILERRLAGASRSELAKLVGVSPQMMWHLLNTAHAKTEDFRSAHGDMERAKIRKCMCCDNLIISWNPGVRMCAACRAGETREMNDRLDLCEF